MSKPLLQYRKATIHDLEVIVKMLADDELGSQREHYQLPLPETYINAFHNIEKDSNQELMVVEADQEIIATFQMTFLPYLTYQGGIRAQMEAVRVRADHRNQGVGEKICLYAIERAKSKGAHLLQLTTDKKRPEALRFYERLGFVASHEGMKIHFD